MKFKAVLAGIGLFTLLVITGLSAGEKISLSAHLDKTDIPFEDTVEYKLEIKWIGNITSYAFEVLPLPDLENLKVMGTSSSISSSTENGQETTTRYIKYTLKPTLSGVGTIKPITLQCISMPDSTANNLTTPLLTVNIATPIPVEKKSEMSIYLIIALGIIMIAGFVFVVLRMRKKPEIIPEKTPEELFIDELMRLKQDGLSDRKVFFTRLFRMLNIYIEKKYNLRVANQTAEIIVGKLSETDIPEAEKEKISHWLIKAEKEKFAPFGGEPGEVIRLAAELEKHFGKKDISDNSEA